MDALGSRRLAVFAHPDDESLACGEHWRVLPMKARMSWWSARRTVSADRTRDRFRMPRWRMNARTNA